MKLEDIDWENDLITFDQQKTSQPLRLPLLPVVGNAIYDYCTMERPADSHPPQSSTQLPGHSGS